LKNRNEQIKFRYSGFQTHYQGLWLESWGLLDQRGFLSLTVLLSTIVYYFIRYLLCHFGRPSLFYKHHSSFNKKCLHMFCRYRRQPHWGCRPRELFAHGSGENGSEVIGPEVGTMLLHPRQNEEKISNASRRRTLGAGTLYGT
jgi:hypothetical protein